ncbi:hypothetical protein CsSME_00050058 [Camellia sinensis var. sinensis]
MLLLLLFSPPSSLPPYFFHSNRIFPRDIFCSSGLFLTLNFIYIRAFDLKTLTLIEYLMLSLVLSFSLFAELGWICFPGKAAGVRIAGQGAPIEAAPAKKKRCRNPQHFAIINILFHDNKDITPKASNAAVAVALSIERIIRLSWALVHSKQPEDMQHGIAMLEASLANSGSPLQKREKLYLLAIGYYRSGEYRRSRQLAEQCLEIAPDWMQALTLKKTLDDQITKDGLIGIGITATVVGLVAGGIAASLG